LPFNSRRIASPADDNKYRIIDITILNDQYCPITFPVTWEPVVFSIRFHSPARTPGAAVTFQIATTEGYTITFCATTPDQDFHLTFEEGENVINLRFASLALSAGRYVIGAGLAITNKQWLYNEPNVAVIEVAPKDVFSSGFLPVLSRYPVPMPCRWDKPQRAEPRRDHRTLTAVSR
jgi:hypothetical protein